MPPFSDGERAATQQKTAFLLGKAENRGTTSVRQTTGWISALVCAVSGAPAAAYTGQEGSVADINELVSGFPAIAAVCGLDYLGPMWLNGVSYASRDDAEAVARQQALAREYASRLIARIREIRA